MALKQNEDFLRFLTMGAAGTSAVLDDLVVNHGHRCIELERYATANKIWTHKIKRLRLADLVCLDCGLRIEVRTKSNLAIRMSHSDALNRGWDAGLRDNDLVAFVAWNAQLGRVSAHHALFRVRDMREAAPHAKLGPRKAPSEGAERDMTWPARVPKRSGEVVRIDLQAGTAAYQPHDGRAQTYRIKDMPAFAYVEPGERLEGGEQFIIGSVRPEVDVDCPGATWDVAGELWSPDIVDRYTAVKAAGFDASASKSVGRLEEIATAEEDDPRVRLEATASLCRLDASHVDALYDWAQAGNTGAGAEMAMESVFILSEIRHPRTIAALQAIAADSSFESELRCAAVWGLGATGIGETALVLPYIADPDPELALHALAAVGSLTSSDLALLRDWIMTGSDREAASASVLLSEDGLDGLRVLLDIAKGRGEPALRALSALGHAPEEAVREQAGGRLDPRLEAALQPMWLAQRSWLVEDGRSPGDLDLLRRQSVRYPPND